MVDMDRKLKNMPIMAQREAVLDAHIYNLWRRARQRWGNHQRVTLPGLKQINIIMSDQYWVCVDSVRNDLPVLAWVDFEAQNRHALHTPINCKLNYYHFAASAVRAKSLEIMEQSYNDQFAKEMTDKTDCEPVKLC